MTSHNASLGISFKMKQKMRKDSQIHEAWKSGQSYIEIESHIKKLELKGTSKNPNSAPSSVFFPK